MNLPECNLERYLANDGNLGIRITRMSKRGSGEGEPGRGPCYKLLL